MSELQGFDLSMTLVTDLKLKWGIELPAKVRKIPYLGTFLSNVVKLTPYVGMGRSTSVTVTIAEAGDNIMELTLNDAPFISYGLDIPGKYSSNCGYNNGTYSCDDGNWFERKIGGKLRGSYTLAKGTLVWDLPVTGTGLTFNRDKSGANIDGLKAITDVFNYKSYEVSS